MTVILETTKDTPVDDSHSGNNKRLTHWWQLSWEQQKTHPLRPCALSTGPAIHGTKQEVEQVRVHLKAIQISKNPVHDWQVMDRPSRTVSAASHGAPTSKGLGKTPGWVRTLLRDCAAREPRHGLPWIASWAAVQMLVEANSKLHDIVIYTDNSVTRDRSCWGVHGQAHEDSGESRVTTSSLTMEVEAVTHAIQWLASQRDAQITHAIIFTDSMNLLQMVESWIGCLDWHTAVHSFLLQRLLWIYCPGHAGVSGNERADRLASTVDITSGLQHGRAEVLQGLRNFLNMDRP